MTADIFLLFWAITFCAATLFVALYAIKAGAPALLLFSTFTFVYFSIRPLMLLTGVYGVFGRMHFGSERLESNELLFPVMAFCTLAFVLTVASYLSRPYVAAKRRALGWPARIADSRLLFFAVWIGVVALAALPLIEAVKGLMFGFSLFGCCYFLACVGRADARWLWRTFGVAGLMVLLATTDERRDWAVGLYVAGWVLLLAKSSSSVRRAIYGVMLAVGVVFVAVALRTQGTVKERLSGANGKVLIVIAEWELDFPIVYDDLVILFRDVPRHHRYKFGESVAKPFFAWLPRDLWREKPSTLSREFSRIFNSRFYDAGGSEPVTLAGDLYWNFGWFGLVFCLLVGRVQRAIDDTYKVANAIQALRPRGGGAASALCVTLAGMLFYLYRGPLDTVWLNFLFTLLLAWLVARLQMALFAGQSSEDSTRKFV